MDHHIFSSSIHENKIMVDQQLEVLDLKILGTQSKFEKLEKSNSLKFWSEGILQFYFV